MKEKSSLIDTLFLLAIIEVRILQFAGLINTVARLPARGPLKF